MNCIELTNSIIEFKNQKSKFDIFLSTRNTVEAKKIEKSVRELFTQKEFEEFYFCFDRYNDQEHYVKELTRILKKEKKGRSLDKQELIFIYGIDDHIHKYGLESTGWEREILDKRDVEKDLNFIFNKGEIARTAKEVNEKTKIYIGQILDKFFEKHKNIELIYTSFPHSRVRRQEIRFNKTTKEDLIQELKKNSIIVTNVALEILNRITSSTKQVSKFITYRIKIESMGFTTEPTLRQTFERAKELGLELCPDELGPFLLLNSSGRGYPYDCRVAMKSYYAGSPPQPSVLAFKTGKEPKLFYTFAYPDTGTCAKSHEYVFCVAA